MHIGLKVFYVANVVFGDIIPTIKLIVDFKIFFTFFRPPHWLHAFSIQGFRFGEIPNVELILDILTHVTDSKVEPLLVTSRVCIFINEEMILL